MATDKLKVLIADDHALFRSGVVEILSDCAEVALVDEASTGAEALKKIKKKHYDCVLIDIFMPGENGIEVLKQLKNIDPHTRALVLSMYPVEQYGVRALKAGASGFLSKCITPEVLKEAIGKVSRGQKYITPDLAERLSEEIVAGSGKLPHERLTDRELQVFIMIALGKTVSQIARELYLSVKTVSTHRVHILQKMGLKNNAELIQYAVKNGLVY